jgi:hypothetical protein
MFYNYFHAEILKWEGKLLISLQCLPAKERTVAVRDYRAVCLCLCACVPHIKFEARTCEPGATLATHLVQSLR